jgi:hypothetical protein
LSAAHFAQVLEKDRHRFQPVAVAVDHGMFQAGVYLCGAIDHRHGSSPLSISIIASPPSRQTASGNSKDGKLQIRFRIFGAVPIFSRIAL